MSEHVDPVNMVNTFSVKEEQCQEDSFVEDKVYISETTITIDNAEIQSSIWQDNIKQYEESRFFDNIKTDLASFEVTEVQNDNVKIEREMKADDIKIEFGNGLLYCEHCEAYYADYCIECGMLVKILNKNIFNSVDSGAREGIPNDILEIQDCFGRTGIFALRIIPACVTFGPFTGLSTTECPWVMEGEKFVLDRNKWKYLNWMQYVHPTKNTSDRNMCVFQSEDNIYYRSTRQIRAGEELLVYFDEEYEDVPNKIVSVDLVTFTKDISKDVFACTFCCLGFSSKLHLTKHKTRCVEDTAGMFSIAELTQCPFCKIHLDTKEYLEHHMTFCCERNARKCILPTPTANQATTTLNGRKRCLLPIYKCEQCKYRTKYQTDLKQHTNNHHYEVKMYKCGICNRRFKTKKSLSLHVKNTHAYVGGKDNQQHSTRNYRNTHIKVEQSSSQDQKKIFKCSLCLFRGKYKQSVRIHIKTKHLKIFHFKCVSCEYRTNCKHNLEIHLKSKHLQEFDFKCDFCEYRTNRKHNLESHLKTKHLQEFDFKCYSCEYRTNNKHSLERHLKTKHLKQFDFKCESCEFRTNNKHNLGKHIKAKHLKQFDYLSDNCEYRKSSKRNLKVHLNTKHLKQFDFKCESCEFRTNNKHNLATHIKTNHLKQFDFMCDSCEFRTNIKRDLQRHIKTKHLKEFDFKCDSCDFRTNIKRNLQRHIKTKHLKEFDFKCASCKYRTNIKPNLQRHIKTKHLKEFDFKCDSCEYRTNIKRNLQRHIKTKHLKEFDFKCDSCEYRTNVKNNLERHMKQIHS